MRTNRNLIEFEATFVRRRPLTDLDRADLPNIAARHRIAHELGFPVPRVLAVNSDHLVLERAGGTPLLETDLPLPAQRRLGEQLANLLTALRSVREWPLPVTPWPHLWSRLHEAANTSATGAALRVAVGAPLTMTHGDLSGGNLLVSAAGDLVAVIDWDGATLADPAQDYSALCANVPPAVADVITERTPHASELRQRADVYMATWADQHRLWLAGHHPWIDQDADSPP